MEVAGNLIRNMAYVRARWRQWKEDCLKQCGRVLMGKYRHWCADWDDLPIDDTREEFKAGTCEKERIE
jgi:hypothetical protein